MMKNVYLLRVFFEKFKPHILIILTEFGYTFLYFFTDASFKHGMNPHIHVTYRQIVATIALFPFAYFLERKSRPRITVALFLEIFVLSLFGTSLSQNMYYSSMRYTSPTFLSSMVNTIACLTFIIAVMFKLEAVDLRNPRGIAKVLGTLVSLGGAMVMTFYKGPIITNLWHPLIHMQHTATHHVHENWLKGSVLTVSSCISWALSYIMQAFTLKRYPAQLSLTTWMNLIGAAQTGVFALLTQHKPGVWKVGINIDLWCIMYAGIVGSALVVYIQLWCTEKKGPVFATMYSPLGAVLVALLAYFVLGQRLYVGSIVGGVIVLVGLYLLLWGKEDVHKLRDESIASNHVSHDEP